MKNKPILLSTILVAMFTLTLISGCKKEEDDNNNNNTGTAKIKTISYYDNWLLATVTQTFAYDNQGRIVTETRSYDNGNPSKVDSYTYGTNSVTISFAGLGTTLTYSINSNGYLTEYLDGPCTYDTDGHLVSNDSYSYTWVSGNLTQEIYLYTSTVETSRTYLADKTNTIGNANKGMAFMGKDSKNLVQSTTVYSGQTYQHSYEYDSKGRVSKMTGEYGTTYNYTYF